MAARRGGGGENTCTYTQTYLNVILGDKPHINNPPGLYAGHSHRAAGKQVTNSPTPEKFLKKHTKLKVHDVIYEDVHIKCMQALCGSHNEH